MWAYAIIKIIDQPLFGYGYFQSPKLLIESGLVPKLEGAAFHNTFIDTALDSGLIVTFFYVLLFIVPLSRLVKYGASSNLDRIIFSLSIAMVFSAIFVNYNIGGVRSVPLTMTIMLGISNWSILERHRHHYRDKAVIK